MNKSIIINSDITDEDEQVTEEIFLKESPLIQDEIKHFQANLWTPYIEEYERVNNIQSLYDQLYKIHQDLQNNSELLELVVSVGLITMETE